MQFDSLWISRRSAAVRRSPLLASSGRQRTSSLNGIRIRSFSRFRFFADAILARPKRRAAHPRFELQVDEPIFHGGNPSEVVFDVLLADEANRNFAAVGVRQR